METSSPGAHRADQPGKERTCWIAHSTALCDNGSFPEGPRGVLVPFMWVMSLNIDFGSSEKIREKNSLGRI